MSTTKWGIDPMHSEVTFKVKHMMISSVSGNFTKFDSAVETTGDDFTTARIDFSADVNSISTNNEQRDGHLKAGDFFDAENHPKLTFTSTKMEKKTDEEYKLHGNLSLRGVTKPIVLDVEFGGIAKDAYGNTRAGFSLAGKINRKDFGISFGMVTETGGIVVGDEVKLNMHVQYIKQ
ncbi:MAG TPA: YceI family protein [Flavobacteriales bacterium]|nr:YceI family protein [Flavobacteriales bacterium]